MVKANQDHVLLNDIHFENQDTYVTVQSEPNFTKSVDFSSERKLLIVFTTFKASKERETIYKTCIRNWMTLSGEIQPVLYASSLNDTLATYASQHGWHVYPIPRANPSGTPFLKDMYIHAESHYTSNYFAYANGDLIFDAGVQNTLKAALTQLKQQKTMVIGRRTNYVLKNVHQNLTESSVTALMKARKMHASQVRLFVSHAIDYFIFRQSSVSWHHLPDLVIGRPAYDNYLIHFALNAANVTVIDATTTIRALHLQGPNWTLTHRKDNDTDYRYNFRVIAKAHHLHRFKDITQYGSIKSAQMRSVGRKGGVINFIYKAHSNHNELNQRMPTGVKGK